VSVAKALGDTVKVLEQHYMPQLEKMKDVHVEETKRANAAQLLELDALENKDVAQVVEIGGRR